MSHVSSILPSSSSDSCCHADHHDGSVGQDLLHTCFLAFIQGIPQFLDIQMQSRVLGNSSSSSGNCLEYLSSMKLWMMLSSFSISTMRLLVSMSSWYSGTAYTGLKTLSTLAVTNRKPNTKNLEPINPISLGFEVFKKSDKIHVSWNDFLSTPGLCVDETICCAS